MEYVITVITGIRKGAGTDASVTLVIKGNAKHSGKIQLDNLIYWYPKRGLNFIKTLQNASWDAEPYIFVVGNTLSFCG